MPNSGSKKVVTLNRSLLLVLLALVFSVGVFMGKGIGILGTIYEGAPDVYFSDEGGEFRFIRFASRLRHADGVHDTKELKPFRYKVDALIESKLKAGEASLVSVYFRDLNNGLRFGIREQEELASESILKLPLMIAYFKWAESNPLVLRRKISCAGNNGRTERQSLTPVKALENGKSYAVDDLIFRMIAYDDIDAHTLLAANLPPGYIGRIFKDIYVNYNPAKYDDAVPFNAYASFYRVLFNASYLSREMSEKALRYLSRSAFKEGIAAGIPPDIESARKFGERSICVTTTSGETDIRQLHEFGIIYHQQRPCLLGVMVRGNDAGKLVGVIRAVTALVYEEVDRQSR